MICLLEAVRVFCGYCVGVLVLCCELVGEVRLVDYCGFWLDCFGLFVSVWFSGFV